MKKIFKIALFLFFALFLSACGTGGDSTPGLKANQEKDNSWSPLTAREKSELVIRTAMTYEGKYGGDSQTWIRTVLEKASDNVLTNRGNPSQKVTNACFLGKIDGMENKPRGYDNIKRGDIVLRHLKKGTGDIQHSSIVFDKTGSGDDTIFLLLDSNFDGQGVVRLHKINGLEWNRIGSGYDCTYRFIDTNNGNDN